MTILVPSLTVSTLLRFSLVQKGRGLGRPAPCFALCLDQIGQLEDLGYDLLLANGHDVNPVTHVLFLEELDVPGTDLHALLEGLFFGNRGHLLQEVVRHEHSRHCLLYTSDAADEEDS